MSIPLIIVVSFLINISLFANNISSSCSKSEHFILIDVFKLGKVDYGNMSISDSMGKIDVDGDGINDVLHGDFVGRLFESSGVKLKKFGLKFYGAKQVQGALGDLRYLIKVGKIEKPAGIIMPISRSVNRDVISKRYMPIPEKVDVSVFGKKFREKLYEVDGKGGEYAILASLFLDLKKLGVPVYVPAGNNYSEKINIAGLLGAEVVGALTFDGKKEATYSDVSPITSHFRVGDILSKKVSGGIDISGDGVANFTTSELSNKSNIVLHRGTKSIPIVASYSSELNEFFMSSRKFNELSGIKSKEILNRVDRELGELIHFPSGAYYKIGPRGEILFRPVETEKDYVQFNYGSSFAVGNICKKAL